MDKVEQAVNSNVGLVYDALSKFNLAYNPDAESLALEGLWKAAKAYDETSGVLFSTYATCVVRNELRMYIRTAAAKKNHMSVSIDAAINDDDDSGSLLGMLSKGTLEEEVHKRALAVQLPIALRNVRDRLPDSRFEEIFDVWQESDFTATQTAIAKTVGMSRAFVNRVIGHIRSQLKIELEDYL